MLLGLWHIYLCAISFNYQFWERYIKISNYKCSFIYFSLNFYQFLNKFGDSSVNTGFPDSSVGKESICNAGDSGLIPGSGRCPGEGILTHSSILGLLWWFRQWRICLQCGDLGSIPGLGRSLGGGHGNPLQYSCLEISMDRGVWWAIVRGVAKSWTWQQLSTAQLQIIWTTPKLKL